MSAAKSINFSLKIVHRDSPESPVYPGNLTFDEKIQRYIGFSEARASYLMSSISTHDNSAMHPIANARPEVVPGNAAYMVDPIFDPKASNSFREVSCTKDISCHPYHCVDGQCIYGINYGDGSVSSGYIAFENFSLTTSDTQPFYFSMKFGCSFESRGNFDRKISGILGMNMDPISFMGQLGKQYFSNKFSYCLVDPNTVTHSYLKFGDDVYNGRPVQEFTKKTPFEANPFNNNYYLYLQDISINGMRLNLPEGTFKIKGNGQGGCIIDSGTTITSLKYSVYIRVKDEFEAYFARYGIQRSYGGCGTTAALCFDLPSGFNAFPSMTYHFIGADLYVEPKHGFLLTISHFAPAIKAGDSEFTVLGSWQQQNTRFIDDTDLRQLSFAPEECDKDNP
ncbi:hypothetical protein EZV62_008289 [Acer yangbiense]|uniref:Peptidase A1 domain-containing protein n=1 Tax=Acer yangbiense TaxID=1000413 RepID=A0A5C7ID39_9ROSI|nr:hypothetical protein EZV62_008289 [Acer yangbiense]